MELNWLLLLTALLLHMQLSRMTPTGLICDKRLIQKSITDARDMEETVSHCEELPFLRQPVPLPLVGFSLGEWMIKTNQAKGLEVLQDLTKLVDGAAAAKRQLPQGCAFALLQQLYEKASSFLLQLRNFGWQRNTHGALQRGLRGSQSLDDAGNGFGKCLQHQELHNSAVIMEQDSGGLPERASQLTPETNLRMIFRTYKQLVQGKLRFLFHDLGRDSCGGDSRAASPAQEHPSK